MSTATGVSAYVKGPPSWQGDKSAWAAHFTNVELAEDLLRFIINWDNTYSPSFGALRQQLRALAAAYTAYPADDGVSEWLLIRDDDDIHFPIPEECFAIDDEEIVLLGFSVWRCDLIIFRHHLDRCWYFHGCLSNGYALRRRFFYSLTPEQRRLILGDHINAHRYVHALGKKYLLYPHVASGINLVHPASVSSRERPYVVRDFIRNKPLVESFLKHTSEFVRRAGEILLQIHEVANP